MQLGQSFERGEWECVLQCEGDFNPEELSFGLTRWSGLWLLTTLVYQGEIYQPELNDSTGKSMNCWIGEDSVSYI